MWTGTKEVPGNSEMLFLTSIGLLEEHFYRSGDGLYGLVAFSNYR